MTIAILTFEVANGQSQRLKVRPQQRLLIGASNSADIKLFHPAGVAPQHCEVKFESGTLEIANLTNGKQEMRVNGANVASTKLQHGDCIEVGGNKLMVELESNSDSHQSRTSVSLSVPPPPSVVATASKAADNRPDTAKSSPEPVFSDCGNGVQTFVLSDFKAIAHPIFLERSEHWRYGALLNHRASKLDQPPPESVNLLTNAGPEVTSGNDLYFETGEDPNAVLRQFSMYAEKQSAVLTLIKKRKDSIDYPQELKLLASWFMNPDTLKFNLINGSKLLISKIFMFLDVLVVTDPENRQDTILLNDSSINDWPSFVDRIRGYTHDAGN